MIYGDMSLQSMMDYGADIEAQLLAAGFENLANTQALALAEEVGEFVGAYRRHAGLARRRGAFEDVALELADVVITAFVTATVLKVNLPAAIKEKLNIMFSRGWRESQAVNVIIQPANEANNAKGVNQ